MKNKYSTFWKLSPKKFFIKSKPFYKTSGEEKVLWIIKNFQNLLLTNKKRCNNLCLDLSAPFLLYEKPKISKECLIKFTTKFTTKSLGGKTSKTLQQDNDFSYPYFLLFIQHFLQRFLFANAINLSIFYKTIPAVKLPIHIHKYNSNLSKPSKLKSI